MVTDSLNIKASGKAIAIIAACIFGGVGGGAIMQAGANKIDTGTENITLAVKEATAVANKLIDQNNQVATEIVKQNATLVAEVKNIGESMKTIAAKVDAMNASQMQNRESISGMKSRLDSIEKNVDYMMKRLDDPVRNP